MGHITEVKLPTMGKMQEKAPTNMRSTVTDNKNNFSGLSIKRPYVVSTQVKAILKFPTTYVLKTSEKIYHYSSMKM